MATVRINGEDRVQQEGLTLGMLREGYPNSYVHLVLTSSPETDLRLDCTPLVSGTHYTVIMTPRPNYVTTVVHSSGGSNAFNMEISVRLLNSTEHAAGQETRASNGLGLQRLGLVTPKNQPAHQVQPAEKKRKLQPETVDNNVGGTHATFKSPCSGAVSTRRKPLAPLVDPLLQIDETFRVDWEHLRRTHSKGKLDLSDFDQVMKQLKHGNNNWRVVPSSRKDAGAEVMWTRMPGLKKENCAGYRSGYDYFLNEAQLHQFICAQACLLGDGELVSALQPASAGGAWTGAEASHSLDEAAGDANQDGAGSNDGGEGAVPTGNLVSDNTPSYLKTPLGRNCVVKAPKPSATSSAFDLRTQPTPALQLPVQPAVPVVASPAAGTGRSSTPTDHAADGRAVPLTCGDGRTDDGMSQPRDILRNSDLHTAHSQDSDSADDADEETTQHSLCSGSDGESLQSIASDSGSGNVNVNCGGPVDQPARGVSSRERAERGVSNDCNNACANHSGATLDNHGGAAPTLPSSDCDTKEVWTCSFCTLENNAITDPTECSICGNRRSYGTRRAQRIAASQMA